jgi:hypothetical protein
MDELWQTHHLDIGEYDLDFSESSVDTSAQDITPSDVDGTSNCHDNNIGVSGKNNATSISSTWESLDSIGDCTNWWKEIIPQYCQCTEYVLSWERELLHSLYEKQKTLLVHKSASLLISSLLNYISSMFSVASSLMVPVTLLKFVLDADNPWAIAMSKAKQTGKLLATILIQKIKEEELEILHSKTHGKQHKKVLSYTLIGYGVGAAVIYHCLLEIAKTAPELGKGIIENAILIGVPASANPKQWKLIRGVVAGRLVNCYSTKDWFLALMCRSQNWNISVAGLQPVYLYDRKHSKCVKKETQCDDDLNNINVDKYSEEECEYAYAWGKDVENIDVTDIITSRHSHLEYANALPAILSRVFNPPL